MSFLSLGRARDAGTLMLELVLSLDPLQGTISASALRFVSYDPNYADDDDYDDYDDADDADEAMDDDDDADYSDDDDVSWKVRRAAAKVLSAIIVSRSERLPEILPEVRLFCVSSRLLATSLGKTKGL